MIPLKALSKIRFVIGLLIAMLSLLNFFVEKKHQEAIFIAIVIGFALLALSMNYTGEGRERNAWDVWFFSMPGVLVALFLIGIMANNIDIWRWVAIALGGSVGIGSGFSIMSSVIEKIKKSS